MKKNKFSKYFEKPDMKESKKRTRTKVDVIYDTQKLSNDLIKMLENKTFYIRTYGCQMNEHDTEVMSGLLLSVNMKEALCVEDADIVIFNTCAIRENAENKVFGEIGRLKNLKTENPDKIFAICGCMSQEEDVVNRLLKTYTWIDIIFGTHNIHRLLELLNHAVMDKERVVEVWSKEGEVIENLPRKRASKTSGWVNIIYGCDKFCTYCIVPFTRGKERSRLIEDVLKEIEDLVAEGYKEITLLGQNVNAYGKDLNLGYTLADLLDRAAKLNVPRLRFTTSHPWDFTDEMVDIISKHDNIMPHIHLPVQSGNNEILKIMGRSYTREQYITLFDKLRYCKPNVTITTDIIVGFPNETSEQFEDTMKLYDYCKFDGAFTFVYSPREKTPATKMVDNIDEKTKKERLYRLNDVVDSYAKKSNAQMLSKKIKVLINGVSTKNNHILAGYSENMKLVLVEADESFVGKIIDVEIIETKKYNLIGKLIEN